MLILERNKTDMKRIYAFTSMNYAQLENEIDKIDRKIEDLKSQKRLLKKLQSAELSKPDNSQGNERRNTEQWK